MSLADILFTTEADADANLRREGRPAEAIHFVGNVMVDSLLWALPFSEPSTILDQLGLARAQDFALLTVHRPSNVDVPAALTEILSIVAELADDLPVILPAHPRTRARIAEWGLSRYVRDPGGSVTPRGVLLTEPLGYLDFVHLMQRARVVVTDSGGVQDETTALGVPCLTLRPHTERPVTVTSGTAVLVDRQRDDHPRARASRHGSPAQRAEVAAAAVGRAHRRTHRTHPGRCKRR